MGLLSYFHKYLDNPTLFNFVRHILDGGQIEYMEKYLEGVAHESVVDIACGTGDICKAVKKDYVGIDFCESFITYANKAYGGQKKKFIVMDATRLTLPRKSFDVAMLVNMIHHLNDAEVKTAIDSAIELSKKYVLILDVIPKKNPITKFFLSIDRGANFRPLEAQKELLTNSGKIRLVSEDSFHSTSRIYHHSVLLGEIIN